METPTFGGENPRIHLLELVLTYVKKGKCTFLEVETHLLNKLWCSWQCLSGFSMKNIEKISLILTLIITFQVVHLHGDYFFCFWFVISNSSTFYYCRVMVHCLYRHLPTKLAQFTTPITDGNALFFFCLFMNFPKICFPQKPWLLCLCRGLLPLYKNKVHEFKRIISSVINYTPFAPVLGNHSHRHFLGLVKCNVAKETVIQVGDKSEVTRHTPAHAPPFFKDCVKNYEMNWLGLV